MHLDPESRRRALHQLADPYLDVALENIVREYPIYPWYIATGPGAYPTHREAHPVFFGSFDWHSCVEMHWVIVRLLRLFRPVMPYRDEVELEYPVESVEPLLFLLRRMLDTLCLRLAENWLVAAAMKLLLGFEDKQARESVLRIAEPTRDMDLLLRLLQAHLDGVTASAPITRVALELLAARPVGSQMQIFERGMRDPNRFAETLGQIEAIVGSGNAGRVRLLPSRALDAFEVSAFLEDAKGSTGAPEIHDATAASRHMHGLPLRRIRPARHIEVTLLHGHPSVLHSGGKSQQVVRCSGPWFVSGDWWDDTRWQREVWEVETSEGGLHQIARHNGRWQWEGVFG